MPTAPVSGRADLSDAQWAVPEPLLPVGKKPGRPRKHERRQLRVEVTGTEIQPLALIGSGWCCCRLLRMRNG
jgi:transposase